MVAGGHMRGCGGRHVCGCGGCMVAGGMCGCQGVCMVAGGVCVVVGGMHGWGHAWLRGGMHGCGGDVRGCWGGVACVGHDEIRSMSGR